MTRERAKEICEIIETHGIEVIKAYGEGKTIQHLNLDGEWVDCDMPISFPNNHSYRVKPEGKQYRPFKDCNELVKCWEKKMFIPAVMFTEDTRNKLYRPLIWVKSKEYGTDNLITAFDGNNESIGGSCVFIQDVWVDMKELFDNFTFLDGTPCGITE